jgi:hypothetical protein
MPEAVQTTGYENAPATLLLATHCAACGRPLVDAASVTAAMGPECRSKYGVLSLDDETRAAANVHIYRIALLQTGREVAERLAALRELGLDALADRIVKRLAPMYAVVVLADARGFAVKASYDVAQSASLGRLPGRRWDAERKVSTYPATSKRAVFEALRGALPGALCLGPRGEFTL